MKKYILCLCLIFSLAHVFAQEKEIFPGESKFESCKIEVSMTGYYKAKDKAAYIQKIKKYKDIQLAFLQYNKKTKKATYTIYYFVVVERPDGTIVYLESPKSYHTVNGPKRAEFLVDNPKNDRFYTLDCFMDILARNPELNQIITKKNE